MEVDDMDPEVNNLADTPTLNEGEEPTDQSKGKSTGTLVRESGKSLLPISRVQKIMKADKELPTVAKEAIFLISLATEEFIKRLSEASHHIALREKRVTVQQRDVASVSRRADEFLFLEEIISWPDASDAPGRRKLQGPAKSTTTSTGGKRPISEFMRVDVVMNEDGTMQQGANEEESESDMM